MKVKTEKTNKKSLFAIIGIALAAIIAIPMLYSSIYLSAFWDTYGKLNSVPVAFVNLDKKVSKDGKDYNIGKDVEQNLKDNDKVKWSFVNYNDAKKGVEGSDYYAMIVIPENFSQNLVDSLDGNFQKPEVVYEANKGRNYVFSQISQRVAESIKINIDENIQKETSKALVDSLNEIKDSIKEASNGANKLQDGTQQLYDGSTKLANGLTQATDGSKQLQNGLKDAASGESQVVNGMDTLISGLGTFKSTLTQKNNDIDRLVNGADTLAKGVSQAKAGADMANNQLSQGLNKAADGIDGVSNAVNKAEYLLETAMTNLTTKGEFSEEDKKNIFIAQSILKEVKKQEISTSIASPLRGAANSAQPLVEGLEKLEIGAKGVADGTSKLAEGIASTQEKAAAGADMLISGANKIKDGSSSLLSGLNTAASKTGELKTGLTSLNNGAVSLNNGLGDVNEGTSELNNGLSTGYDKINDKIKFTSDDLANFVSEPVVLKDISINDVKYYGEGLAPYFISLSLWLGAMFTNLGLTLASKFIKNKNIALESFSGKFIIGLAVAVIQSLLLSLVLVKGLNIDTVNVSYFYLINMLIATVFFSVMYGAANIMGVAATPVMFIIFLLQLSSSGGTFPIETAPSFFRVVGQYFPMTYAINALRMIIGGINSAILTKDIDILITFMAAFLILGFAINYFFKYKKASIEKDEDELNNNLETA